MSFSSFFIRRPVATTLLMVAIAAPGIGAFRLLPFASLPQVDYPTIGIMANLPGASPESMAGTVATPLERTLGRIAGITEMTSTSTQGSTRINLQFDLDRNIDGAARDVQSAINAARALLPSSLPSSPTYRKVNAATTPMLSIALTSDTRTQDELYDVAFSILGQKISRVRGVSSVAMRQANSAAVCELAISGEWMLQVIARMVFPLAISWRASSGGVTRGSANFSCCRRYSSR